MKLFIFTTIFAVFLFGSNQKATQKYGKIDMHGGKSEKLINENNSLSNKDIKNIGILTPNTPNTPTKPKNLIKQDKKEK